MGAFTAAVDTDLKVLFRQYRLEISVPMLCVFMSFALYYIKDLHPAMFAILPVLPLISLFERMFSRTDNEIINYHLLPQAVKELVMAKNFCSMIMFLVIALPSVAIPSVLFKSGPDYTVRAMLQVVIAGLFLILAGNIVSVRVVDKHITGISFRNSLIMGIAILIAVVLFQALSAFLGIWISMALCVTSFFVMYPFSSRETACSLRVAMSGFLEAS